MLRLVRDHGSFMEDDHFIKDRCLIEPGGYESTRLMRVTDGARLTVRDDLIPELFEDVPNAVVIGGHVLVAGPAEEVGAAWESEGPR